VKKQVSQNEEQYPVETAVISDESKNEDTPGTHTESDTNELDLMDSHFGVDDDKELCALKFEAIQENSHNPIDTPQRLELA